MLPRLAGRDDRSEAERGFDALAPILAGPKECDDCVDGTPLNEDGATPPTLNLFVAAALLRGTIVGCARLEMAKPLEGRLWPGVLLKSIGFLASFSLPMSPLTLEMLCRRLITVSTLMPSFDTPTLDRACDARLARGASVGVCRLLMPPVVRLIRL
jgi:hypothetical protein